MSGHENTFIEIPGYDKPLPFVDSNVRNYWRHTTVLYGASETGKTILVKWILFMLRLIIASGVVIAPTGAANKAYDGIIPKRCIKNKPTSEDLRIILEKQKNATAIYNRANNLDTLRKLCNRINDLECVNDARRINLGTQKIINDITNSQDLNWAERKEQIKTIEEKRESMLRRVYKRTISKYQSEVVQKHVLSNDEKLAIKYMNFNPNFLLVLDDCASQIAKWAKDDAINQIFFEGRHYYITTIITMQDDKKLDPEIRKNTFNNIFTEANCAIGFFENKANAFTRQIKKDGDKIANFLFAPNANGAENYKKLVYNRRDSMYPFRYLIADEMDGFRMFSPALWEMCDKVPTDEEASVINESSLFYRSFQV